MNSTGGPRRKSPGRYSDRGQVTVFIILVLAIFMLGFFGFAVDLTNLWFHRQAAQVAADAACTAAGMDIYYEKEGLVPATPPSALSYPRSGTFSCNDYPDSSPCKYALLNGYPASTVDISFPGTPPPGVGGTGPAIPAPTYVRADVLDPVRVFLVGLLSGTTTMNVRTMAVCGLEWVATPIPLIVLNPSCSHSFQAQSSSGGGVKIIGGPTRSIQVNSTSNYPIPTDCATATQTGGCSANSPIDLSQGGPNLSGSDLGTNGGPPTQPSGFLGGTEGNWVDNAGVIPDPYAYAPIPDPTTLGFTTPRTGPELTLIPANTPPCPDHVYGCMLFLPGVYNQPILVDGTPAGSQAYYSLPARSRTALFVPGIYIIKPDSWPGETEGAPICGKAACQDVGNITGQCRADFFVDNGGVVRTIKQNASLYTGPTDSIGGTMFYLTSNVSGQYGSVFFGNNAGSYTTGSVDPYNTAGSANTDPVGCVDANAPPPQITYPATLDGNVLLGPCTGPYADKGTNPAGVDFAIRGLLMFQDRANNDYHGQSSMQGGGGLLLSGALYFHNCPNSPTCDQYPTDYNAFVQLQGTAGSATWVVGNITTDQFWVAGNSLVTMVLDPYLRRLNLKVALLQ